jgi:ATP-dependent exoDNAse (exonuclease V) alpha subunit
MVRPTGSNRSTSIMAIYHHSVSVIKRSAGKSSVAAAAYRAGDKLLDLKLGLIHDYTCKSGIDKSMILSPLAADWISDREQLWNRVEAVEKRYDAQLAREVTLAIPIELNREDKIDLVRDYIQNNYIAMGMIADVNFHHLGGDNPHAHIMLTMRPLEVDEQGVINFGNKDRSWNHKDLLIKNRESWAKLANQYLVNAGYPDRQIDHRSNADREIETVPQIHLGAEAAAMRDRGIATDRGNEYERIKIANNNIREKLERIYQSELVTLDAERELAEYETEEQEKELYPNMDFSDDQNVDFSDDQDIDFAEQSIDRHPMR